LFKGPAGAADARHQSQPGLTPGAQSKETMMSNQMQLITARQPRLGLAFAPTVARRTAEAGIEIKDLVRPPAARRGVRPHAADPLSRLERRRAYLPI